MRVCGLFGQKPTFISTFYIREKINIKIGKFLGFDQDNIFDHTN
jgi:hypothetical protein